MKRRLYFLLPDVLHTATVVKELETFGINTDTMHTLAKPGIDLGGLPVASERQRKDIAARIENLLWDGNLAVFFLSLLTLVVMLIMQLTLVWLAIPATIMLLTFLMGVIFTAHIPNVHIAEFRDAVHHGEILLMVDVPVWHVAQVEALVHKHHPEAVVGGVGWQVDALHT